MNLRELVGHKVIRTQPVDKEIAPFSPLLGDDRYRYCSLGDCVKVVCVVENIVMVEDMSGSESRGVVADIDCRFDDDNWKAVDEAWEYVYGNKEKESEPKKPEIYQFDRITRESFSAADLAEHDFTLKEIVYVPHGDKQVVFRVEHVTDEKAYLVAADCVGRAKMIDMNEYLDNFMKELPEDLLDICGEIEHKVNGQLIRKSKVTLLSYGNTTGCENCNGIDDMQFDGLKTEADRCKNDTNGETCWCWEDTPYDYEDWDEDSYASDSTGFLYVGIGGCPYNYCYASGAHGVCPCLSILRKKKKDNSEEQD